MKRMTFWLGAALLTFIIGVAGAWLWFHRSHGQKADALAQAPIASESEMAELSICHLEANAVEYVGKVVRVRAVLSFGKHGVAFQDSNCSSAKTGTWVSATPAMWDEVMQATEKAYGMKNDGRPLDMLAVGRFERNNPSFESDTWADRLPFRFELMRIEKAVKSD